MLDHRRRLARVAPVVATRRPARDTGAVEQPRPVWRAGRHQGGAPAAGRRRAGALGWPLIPMTRSGREVQMRVHNRRVAEAKPVLARADFAARLPAPPKKRWQVSTAGSDCNSDEVQ
jgi:hypothetical protein